MKNEKGSTLLLVLVIILVLSSLGLLLSSATISARLQFNKTDRLNVATDLAEMGITYFEKKIEGLVHSANNSAMEDTKNYLKTNSSLDKADVEQYYIGKFCTALENFPELKNTYKEEFSVDIERSFEISKAIMQGDCRSLAEIPVNFSVKGTDHNDTKMINATAYFIKKSIDVSVPPDAPADLGEEAIRYDNELVIKGNTTMTVPSNSFFNMHVNVQGNSTLEVQGNAYFNGIINIPAESIEIQGNSTLNVYGDAIFRSKINFTGKSYQICITGYPWLIENGKLVYYEIPGNTCSKPKPEYGINVDWSTTEKPIDVAY